MLKHIGPLSIVGFLGLLAAGNAQAASPSASEPLFDGTYRLVSSTKVNEMYTSYNGHSAQCPNRKTGTPPHRGRSRALYDRNGISVRRNGRVGRRADDAIRNRRKFPASSDAGLWCGSRERHGPRSSERFGL